MSTAQLPQFVVSSPVAEVNYLLETQFSDVLAISVVSHNRNVLSKSMIPELVSRFRLV